MNATCLAVCQPLYPIINDTDTQQWKFVLLVNDRISLHICFLVHLTTYSQLYKLCRDDCYNQDYGVLVCDAVYFLSGSLRPSQYLDYIVSNDRMVDK
jgi:hypothetical protein